MKYVFKNPPYIFLVTIFDAVGYLLFFFARRRRQRVPSNPRNILLIRLDHIGDCFMATAVPKFIKENIPNAKVIFLTSSAGRVLLEHNPFVDEVVVYDAPWFLKKAGGRPSFLRVLELLKEKKIDLGIGLRGDVRENILMWLAGIPQRIGYAITGGGFLLTKEVTYRSGAHESAHTIDLLHGLGIQAQSLKPQLYFSVEEEKKLELKCVEWGIGPGEKPVGLQVDAGSRAKEWPRENMEEFLKKFRERFPQHRLVLTGAHLPDGLSLNNELNLTGKTSLRELCLLMKRFACFIGPDSGPTHIAAGLGMPTIFLYSGTNAYEQWKPLSETARVLRHEVPCSPCRLRVCNVQGHPCMANIQPKELLSVLESILS